MGGGGGGTIVCAYLYLHFHAINFKPEERNNQALSVTSLNHLLCNKLFFSLANRTTEHQTLRANDNHWQPMERGSAFVCTILFYQMTTNSSSQI